MQILCRWNHILTSVEVYTSLFWFILVHSQLFIFFETVLKIFIFILHYLSSYRYNTVLNIDLVSSNIIKFVSY